MRGAAGVQLYFPREDDDDMFICQLASIFLSITAHGLTLPCLDQRRFFFSRALSLTLLILIKDFT